MPFWDGPETQIPMFEAPATDGRMFRTWDSRQFRHIVVAFAGQGDNALLRDLAEQRENVANNNADMVFVVPPGVSIGETGGVPVVEDAGGRIEALYRPLLPAWNPPVAFFADRFGELSAWADAADPDGARHIVEWAFSAEVQCAL